jgi:RNA polymerase sigma-54 factor
MKQGFSLSFAQNLSLTPSLQQAIKLLQMSSLELQDEIHAQVADNPFLALDTVHSHPSIAANGSVSDAYSHIAQGMQSQPLPTTVQAAPEGETLAQERHDTDNAEGVNSAFDAYDSRSRSGAPQDANDDADEYLGWVVADATTLREHLHAQARLLRGDSVTLGVLGLLIDTLLPTGYFEGDLNSLHETLATHCDAPNDTALHTAVQAALTKLHSLDPCGVGAFDLQHCLRLQLQHINPPECVLDAKVSTHAAAQRVVNEGFDCLSHRDRAGLKKQLKLDDLLLGKAIDLIRQLDPKPGLLFAPEATEYAVPEVMAVKVGAVWQARLNPAVVPPLRVADTHAKFIKGKNVNVNTNVDIAALQAQLQNAKALVRTVQQHFDTVFRVGQAIVAAQQDFFSFGATKIKPMVLRDIAEVLGLHESTVSRVTTKKYLQSPHGVFELKYFFSSQLSNDNGDASSSTAIKAHLQPLIQGEPPHKPLSDQALTDALNAAGFQLARRTVAKYREQLGYAPAHARKPL